MEVQRELVQAFHGAIEGLDRPLPGEPLPTGDPDKALMWIEEWLGWEDSIFLSIVEWPQFDTWGLESVNSLRPLRNADIRLTLDGLYDENGVLRPNPDDPFGFDLGGLFIPELNRQLADHSLQLAIIGLDENPRIVCITTNDASVDALRSVLNKVGIDLITEDSWSD